MFKVISDTMTQLNAMINANKMNCELISNHYGKIVLSSIIQLE